MEVERMVAHMQRQEDKTAEMRALLISQNEKLAAQADEIKGLKSALKNSAEQSEDRPFPP